MFILSFLFSISNSLCYKYGLCETFAENNISVSWDGGANKPQGLVSKNLYGIKSVGMDQGRLAANIHSDAYIDFNEIGHNSNLDLKWQITIPLAFNTTVASFTLEKSPAACKIPVNVLYMTRPEKPKK